ncbi:Rrf2 family transcriptional regulator [Devosia pacifica]|uniref:Rrf2 family transcriptional regulator n=1 Tax=Devosia pacifica TaxID=1335967 RepID=A0A918S5U9_9HYPH|nr:Rrf2 family transcriptional regulator [Devosia pacifica]GHA22351.1 Rrf2 family transcriptional regulator [Devosia pacifica]
MRLTQFSDFALRLLILMAADPTRQITIAEVAKTYGVSRNHMMKVANRLAHAGLVRPSRGRRGGLALARDAEEISLGEVLRVTEPDFALVGCMAGQDCAIAANCRLPRALNAALLAFMQVADTQRLSSFVVAPPRIEAP